MGLCEASWTRQTVSDACESTTGKVVWRSVADVGTRIEVDEESHS